MLTKVNIWREKACSGGYAYHRKHPFVPAKSDLTHYGETRWERDRVTFVAKYDLENDIDQLPLGIGKDGILARKTAHSLNFRTLGDWLDAVTIDVPDSMKRTSIAAVYWITEEDLSSDTLEPPREKRKLNKEEREKLKEKQRLDELGGSGMMSNGDESDGNTSHDNDLTNRGLHGSEDVRPKSTGEAHFADSADKAGTTVESAVSMSSTQADETQNQLSTDKPEIVRGSADTYMREQIGPVLGAFLQDMLDAVKRPKKPRHMNKYLNRIKDLIKPLDRRPQNVWRKPGVPRRGRHQTRAVR
ncbi:unnamed protein product [Zymoseptoria tritici ST99CH_3D1]|nr:unnamed protein product [Zymoseptoria tritici ST99CH_3D1]